MLATDSRPSLQPISASAIFGAFDCKPVGVQALEILRSLGRQTETLKGPDPFVKRGMVVLVPLPIVNMSRRFIRRLPMRQEATGYRSTDLPLFDAVMGMGLVGTISEALIIDERRLGSDGRIPDQQLDRFVDALKTVCGYQPKREPSGRSRDWRAQHAARRNERRAERYGELLSVSPA